MSDTENTPNEIATLLIEEYDISLNHGSWSAYEERRINNIITSYVEQMDNEALTELILHAEKETASVEEFIDTLCHKGRGSAGKAPDWLTLLQAMAGFILTRALEAQPAAALA